MFLTSAIRLQKRIFNYANRKSQIPYSSFLFFMVFFISKSKSKGKRKRREYRWPMRNQKEWKKIKRLKNTTVSQNVAKNEMPQHTKCMNERCVALRLVAERTWCSQTRTFNQKEIDRSMLKFNGTNTPNINCASATVVDGQRSIVRSIDAHRMDIGER